MAIINDNNSNIKMAKQRKEATKQLLLLFKRVDKLERTIKKLESEGNS